VTAAVGQVQAVCSVAALLPYSRVHETMTHLHGISEETSQSTLTAQQAEIQFKMKFVKKITNSANHGRNQLFVRFGASRDGKLAGFRQPIWHIWHRPLTRLLDG
jgi:hypothetical protein